MPVPAPGSVVPSDTVISPLVQQLVIVAQQIQGIGRCYAEAPDGAPEDNSVLFPLKQFTVKDATNGRLTFELTFEIIHCFRRARLPDTLARIYAVMPAWWTVLADWPNLTLGGLADLTNVTKGSIGQVQQGGQMLLALTHTVTVLYEFNIPVS